MKTFIVTLFTVFILFSCQEEEVQPGADPFVGAWHLENTDIGLQVSFEVTQTGNDLTFHDINIEYPEITEALNYKIETFDRFAVNAGYEEIRITGNGDQQWIIINMERSIVHLETPGKMDVYTMEINVINREPITLQGQVFEKL